MTGSVRIFENQSLSQNHVFSVAQGQTSKYDRLAQLFTIIVINSIRSTATQCFYFQMSEEKPVLLRAISTNSNGSSAFSQEYNEFLKSEGAACMFDMNCFSSDDGAVSTDISATGKTPCLDDYPGKLDFRIELSDDIRGEAETVTSKVNCTYSDALDKIFIKKNVLCLLTFKVNRLSSGLQVRLLPVFESSEHLECSVVRCPFHQSQDVIAHRRHIIRYVNFLARIHFPL